MQRKTTSAEMKASGDRGEVSAYVSVFGNIDKVGDRVVAGAFKQSLLEWKMSGDPLPIVFAHGWDDPMSHIGVVTQAREDAKGLLVDYQLDIKSNPTAAHVFELLKSRRIREHSFAYDVLRERRAKDGANELLDLRLIECGPCLKGANAETELVGVKSAPAATLPAPALSIRAPARLEPASGGMMPCAARDCWRVASLPDAYCTEHRQPASRTFWDSTGPRDLDRELAAALIDEHRARDTFDRAAEYVASLHAQIAAFDRRNGS